MKEAEGHVKREEEPVLEVGEGDEAPAVRPDAESVEAEIEVIQVDSDSCKAKCSRGFSVSCSVEN